MPNLDLFDIHLHRWSAKAAGDPFTTDTSDLLPVILARNWADLPAMIKITLLISTRSDPLAPVFHLNLTHALTLACCFYVQQETRSD
ncbi:hypothetical protein [Comamonas thiooxydans]|uniref:hypothetical protein n=1 Tax=Comamonas thiooxydans TaxID=363952 RepID=UPI0021152082|nr:hypothetical protein [Comamonas thiooxydans]UUE94144.1 hypothetical protein MJ608_00070 [Comamonas thiooxydans]